jgi:hypothetical protein
MPDLALRSKSAPFLVNPSGFYTETPELRTPQYWGAGGHPGQSSHRIRDKIEMLLHRRSLGMFKNLLSPKIQQNLNPVISKHPKME